MAVTTSRWSRRYALISVFALVCWQIGILLDVPQRTEIILGIFGFVFHMIFGKAYALVPSYFESELAFPQAPKIQFPLVVSGTIGLVVVSLGSDPRWLTVGSTILWCLGIAVFVGTLLGTIGMSLLRGKTGTGEHNIERRPVDRLSNVFIPVALLYLLIGTYETAALYSSLSPLFDGVPAQASHLLVTGTATILVFALGFRLFPRFLGAHPSIWMVRIVLPTAAVGPVLIVAGITNRQYMMLGAVLESIAVCSFAIVVVQMFLQSDRLRTGLYGVLAGVVSGVGGVLLGISFAFHGISPSLITLHFRLNVLGFLGLTIIGLTYQFYPPSVGEFPGSSDRTALLSLLGFCLGLSFHITAVFGGVHDLITIGYLSVLASSIIYLYLVISVFVTGA